MFIRLCISMKIGKKGGRRHEATPFQNLPSRTYLLSLQTTDQSSFIKLGDNNTKETMNIKKYWLQFSNLF